MASALCPPACSLDRFSTGAFTLLALIRKGFVVRHLCLACLLTWLCLLLPKHVFSLQTCLTFLSTLFRSLVFVKTSLCFYFFSETSYYCPTDARGHPDARWWREAEPTRWSSTQGARCVPIGPEQLPEWQAGCAHASCHSLQGPGENSAQATTSPSHQPGSAPFRLGPPVRLAHGHARTAE